VCVSSELVPLETHTVDAWQIPSRSADPNHAVSMRARLILTAAIAAAPLIPITACDRAATADAATIRADSVRRDSIARATQDSINRTLPGYVVDSIFPVEEEVRRFKAKIGGAPLAALQSASESREALVRRIVRDVAMGDTTDLAATAITPREFIDLVYPSSPYTHPPYKESPAIVWMQIANPSNSGFLRLTRRLGGRAFEYESHRCADKPERQGQNTLWVGCTIRVLDPQHETITQTWFGTIIERDGRFKVMSFRNQF
jgi:hypothetical protein